MTFSDCFAPAQIAERLRGLSQKREVLAGLSRALNERRGKLANLQGAISARQRACRDLVSTSLYAEETRP